MSLDGRATDDDPLLVPAKDAGSTLPYSIPIAALATSAVNQLNPSPAQPNAFSPSSPPTPGLLLPLPGDSHVVHSSTAAQAELDSSPLAELPSSLSVVDTSPEPLSSTSQIPAPPTKLTSDGVGVREEEGSEEIGGLGRNNDTPLGHETKELPLIEHALHSNGSEEAVLSSPVDAVQGHAMDRATNEEQLTTTTTTEPASFIPDPSMTSPPIPSTSPTTTKSIPPSASSRIPASFVIPPFSRSTSSSVPTVIVADTNTNSTMPTASPPRRRPSALIPIIASSPNSTVARDPVASTSGTARSREPSVKKEGSSEERRREREAQKDKDSTRSRRVLGEWAMSKTLGAGSMGKVKLGISSVTGEKVAIKIIPRFTSTAAAARPRTRDVSGSTTASAATNGDPTIHESPRRDRRDKLPPSASYLAQAAAKDASKEVRTLREASMCLLLHHPYVCGMKSMILYPHHYYMVFEYVNGGQLLDYIISHGRLRERSARKFARQIGSALEYCHANSIVHRDLKIENILISKTGNIKIIDFGLSNLYSPLSHLSTFCGSLYFAAPELLNARPYTGPEVDVWSFGIVLYVLVCGKVPFDDQSKPALHAKIKRGHVEYPEWLSAECKNLLSRMLVTSPGSRATLNEVLSHPWIVKGFTGPPTDHLPPRTPLTLAEIDPEVIKGMLGFEFGTEEEIRKQLEEVLESDLYKSAVTGWEAKSGNASNSLTDRPSTRVDGKDVKGNTSRSPTKRFSMGFYSKKLTSAFSGSKSDDEGAAVGSVNGTRPDSPDPTRGFNPLISIYYLVKEKHEREKIWGPGVFASSTVSLNGPPPPPAPAIAYAGTQGIASPSMISGALPSLPLAVATTPTELAPMSPLLISPMTPQPRPRASIDEFAQHPATAPASRGEYSMAPPTSPSPRDRRSVHLSPTPLDDDDTPTSSSGFARRFNSLIGRSSSATDSDFKRHRQRASIAPSKVRNAKPVAALPQVEESLLRPDVESNDVGVRRAKSMMDPMIHERGATVMLEPTTDGNVIKERPFATIGVSAGQSRVDPVVVESNEQGIGFLDRSSTLTFKEAKPVYLKGLFSVATTSTKATATIRVDLERVLDRIGVHHRQIKSGFECFHAPSIDLSTVTSPRLKPSIRRKTSTLTSPISPSQSSLPTSTIRQRNDTSSSSFTVSPVVAQESDLVVRFEIFIVKMPLLPGISGLQFRRICGDAWQYQMLAKRVLAEFALKI